MQDPYKNRITGTAMEQFYCKQTEISMEKKSANKYVLVSYTK